MSEPAVPEGFTEMGMFRAYSLKVQKPDAAYFNRLFAEAKWWTNAMIEAEDLKAFDTKQTVVGVKRGEAVESETLQYLSAQTRQQLYRRMWDNLKGLKARKANGGKVGRLKFRAFVNSIPLSNQSFSFKGNRLKLGKAPKTFRVLGLHQLGNAPDIRNGRLIRKPSGIYLSVTVRLADEPVCKSGYIGVDMGVKDALVFNDGTAVNFADKGLERQIRAAHRSISRKEKGSKNREKAKAEVRRLEEKYRNRQDDAVNKLVNKLSPHTVVMQDELLARWKRLFGKKMQRGILGRFKAKLKTDSATVVLPASYPTTQFCPACSSLNKHALSERTYRCGCGYSAPRDKHAALNMLILGVDSAAVESVSDVGKILSGIQSAQLTVKQEAPCL